MIIVTGGAGFIGSNLVAALNARGRKDVLVVDDLTEGVKFRNLADLCILDYIDKDEFLALVERRDPCLLDAEAVLHHGACSDTFVWDGRYMMQNNYRYSRVLLDFCAEQRLPLLYASSAAVYGGSGAYREEPACEAPLNVYGYSKLLFDQLVRRRLPRAESPVVGLRYFNVYGPREAHKGKMSSVALRFYNQCRDSGCVRLLAGSGGYEDGEQRRDFVHVDDVVGVNLWFLEHPEVSGIFNVGTGHSHSFNEIAQVVLAHYGKGVIEYIPFPEELAGCYQNFTEADLTRLRGVGYDVEFRSLERGVREYLTWLDSHTTPDGK